jgi:hypothetical protein
MRTSAANVRRFFLVFTGRETSVIPAEAGIQGIAAAREHRKLW